MHTHVSCSYLVQVCSKYAIKSARSFFFLIPANTILVPGMYLAGFSRYTHNVSFDHVIPFFTLAAEYAKPAACPAFRPIIPQRLGPALCLPPLSTVWHCAHFCLNILAPFVASPAGTSSFFPPFLSFLPIIAGGVCLLTRPVC